VNLELNIKLAGWVLPVRRAEMHKVRATGASGAQVRAVDLHF
jgi:hypothetical protein